jgi:hypothetical protein
VRDVSWTWAEPVERIRYVSECELQLDLAHIPEEHRNVAENRRKRVESNGEVPDAGCRLVPERLRSGRWIARSIS